MQRTSTSEPREVVANRMWSFQRPTDRRPDHSDSKVQRNTRRVLYLIDTLNVGGTETQVAHVVPRLRSRSYDVVVGCLRAEGSLLEALKRGNVPIVEFRKDKTLLSLKGVYQLFSLARFLRQGRFHAVHAHDIWSNLLGIPAAWLARTPIIISSRRYLAYLGWYTPRRSAVMRMIYRLSTHVIVNSSSVRDLLVQRDGLPPEKIRVLHNAVDVDRFATAQRDREHLFPGTGPRSRLIAVVANMYSRVKGHTYLISAASTVCQDIPEAVFVLIGDGKERRNLEQQVRQAGLEKNFLFLGSRSDVPELLACCDLFVLPSEAEALPNALLEAMATGLPVVGTRVGGIPEIITDGVNGLLVPTKNPPALAEAILRILQNPGFAKQLSQAGQEMVRTHFGFDRLLAELEQLYTPAENVQPRHARQLAYGDFDSGQRKHSIGGCSQLQGKGVNCENN
jgi:glycosyltransferase involved in cell wall biosynthesis